MLSENDLLIHYEKPRISDISLSLYNDFYRHILLNRIFKYTFIDGDKLDVYFWNLGLYHLLGIQHIDYRITKENFSSLIDNGLDLNTFKSDKKMNKRFNDMKDRIELFSCTYYSMKHASVFYVPTETVKDTKNVKLDYILYRQINTYGFNLGMKMITGVMTPITILVDRSQHRMRHLDTRCEKIVSRLDIVDINTNEPIDHLVYSDKFIASI